ncbi:MAG: hypothetical protein JJ863_35080 [Deltaproteobacteria bacterium]|nr:hypothetical protein [Deltaproteobacteria bacterium]
MNVRNVAAFAVAITVAVLAWWLWPTPEPESASDAEPARTRFPTPPGMDAPDSADTAEAERPTDEEARRQVAEALREAIRRARDERLAAEAERSPEGTPPSPSSAPATAAAASAVPPEERAGSMDSEYIRDAVQSLRPLLAECYELARDAAERDERPPPEGRLVTRFVFTGEPDVGGVVEESSILEESTLRDSVLEECFSETLFTLELPAPDEGGTITVHYPFQLSNEPEAEAAN